MNATHQTASSAGQGASTAGQRRLLQAALILGITLLAFLPAMRAGFLWDDNRYVTENRIVQSDHGLSYIWRTAHTRDYYPVLYTSFWLEWRLWKANPAGYHLTNLLLHGLSAILLWQILMRLGVPGAWLCGVLFAVHPLNVESVAWISQRKNTLSMFFFLLCGLAFPWREGPRAFPRYSLALLLFILSLLTKPIAIMFPFVIIAYRWTWGGVSRSARGDADPMLAKADPEPRFDLRSATAEALPFFAVSGICGVMTVVFQQAHALKGVPVGAQTWGGQLLTAARALLFYVGKALAPIRLATVYPQWATDEFSFTAFLPLLLIVAILLLLYRKRATWGRVGLFAFACYALMLFPVLGFVEVGFMFYAMVSDHWVYPALPALIAIVVAPLASAFSRRSAAWRSTGRVLAALVVLLLGTLTFRQTLLYRDMRTLAADTVRKNPRAWVAHVILGNAAFSEGSLATAERHYQAALRENPSYWEALNGLGIVSAMQGHFDRAIDLFVAVLDAKPEHAPARRNLELARRQRAAREEAEQTTHAQE